MSEACRFDDSLPRLLKILTEKLGPEQTEAGVVLRDATGCLSFFASEEIDDAVAEQIDSLSRAALGAYARPDRLLVRPGDSGAERTLRDPDALVIRTTIADVIELEIHYLDRRIVGADWLNRPTPPAVPSETGAPATRALGARRVAFATLKGGVGRSTALTIVAADQARKGRNVLVVDLDLEAPGIGSLLLSSDRMPSFGVIDYLVERNFGEVDDVIVSDMVGTSALTQGQGLVSVVPAVGTRTLAAPGNYLAKLSRAMVEAVGGAGGPVSVAGKLREMLDRLEGARRYDLVLIDVRAGLAELTAGPLLALDAEVMIFGTAQRQTIQDLSFLMAHLATLTGDAQPFLRERLKMVHAKASATTIQRFRNELWDLFSSYLYVEAVGLQEFNFDADAPEAPHYPIVIPLDTAFADWDPVANPDKLVEDYYARTFIQLLNYIDDILSTGQVDVED